jgi:hypothetical protein
VPKDESSALARVEEQRRRVVCGPRPCYGSAAVTATLIQPNVVWRSQGLIEIAGGKIGKRAACRLSQGGAAAVGWRELMGQ